MTLFFNIWYESREIPLVIERVSFKVRNQRDNNHPTEVTLLLEAAKSVACGRVGEPMDCTAYSRLGN